MAAAAAASTTAVLPLHFRPHRRKDHPSLLLTPLFFTKSPTYPLLVFPSPSSKTRRHLTLSPVVSASLMVQHLWYSSLRFFEFFHSIQNSVRVIFLIFFLFCLFKKETVNGVRKSWSGLTSLNNWVVKDYYRLVNSVNSFEPLIQNLSDEQVGFCLNNQLSFLLILFSLPFFLLLNFICILLW